MNTFQDLSEPDRGKGGEDSTTVKGESEGSGDVMSTTALFDQLLGDRVTSGKEDTAGETLSGKGGGCRCYEARECRHRDEAVRGGEMRMVSRGRVLVRKVRGAGEGRM